MKREMMSQDLQPHSSFANKRPPLRLRELDRVALLCDLPENALRRGEAGTIVHVFDNAHACLVEFVNPQDGSPRALVELTPDQLSGAR